MKHWSLFHLIISVITLLSRSIWVKVVINVKVSSFSMYSCIYTTLLYLSIDKNLGFFPCLGYWHKPLWTWGWRYLWGLVFTFFRYSRSGVAGLYRSLIFFTFWDISILTSIVTAPISVPINSAWGFPFSTFLPALGNILPFWKAILTEIKPVKS